jgi:hypothetical protein
MHSGPPFDDISPKELKYEKIKFFSEKKEISIDEEKPVKKAENEFKRLIKNKTFIDKSLFIKETITRWNDHVQCILRPPGFGKTVNLRMLECFFDDTQNEENVFENLAILKLHPEYKKYMGQYPVVFLSLAELETLEVDRNDNYFDHLKKIFISLYDHYAKKYASAKNAGDFKVDHDRSSIPSLYHLIESVHTASGKQPILLIDGYDTILFKAYQNNQYTEVYDMICDLLSPALKDNDHLGRAILMGVTKPPEINFRGLNNIVYDSLLHPHCSDFFGFNDDDIQMLLERFHLSDLDVLKMMKQTCGGYPFKSQNLFNPRLVMQRIYDPYVNPVCSNSDSRISFVKKYIEDNPEPLLEIFTSVTGQKISIFMTLEDLKDNHFMANLLFLMGLLVIQNAFTVQHISKYLLRSPNENVSDFFKNMIAPLTTQPTQFRRDSLEIKKDNPKKEEALTWHFLKKKKDKTKLQHNILETDHLRRRRLS